MFVVCPHPAKWAGLQWGNPLPLIPYLTWLCRLHSPAPCYPEGRCSIWQPGWLRGEDCGVTLPAGFIPAAGLVANPLTRFPQSLGGRRILDVLFDWVTGARLVGLSPRWVRRVMTPNAREAGAVAEGTRSRGGTGSPKSLSAYVLAGLSGLVLVSGFSPFQLPKSAPLQSIRLLRMT